MCARSLYCSIDLPADDLIPRITEEVLQESIDARTESLISLRELGPPDLVHLLKQQARNSGKHVRYKPDSPRC